MKIPEGANPKLMKTLIPFGESKMANAKYVASVIAMLLSDDAHHTNGTESNGVWRQNILTWVYFRIKFLGNQINKLSDFWLNESIFLIVNVKRNFGFELIF